VNPVAHGARLVNVTPGSRVTESCTHVAVKSVVFSNVAVVTIIELGPRVELNVVATFGTVATNP
jgi:hypothetical protein